MKLYACYTPSHERLLREHFMPSLPAPWAAGVPMFPRIEGVSIRALEQQSRTGEFNSAGFLQTCLDKVAAIQDAILCTPSGELFVFCDVDIRFYGPVVNDLRALVGDSDMAFQWDGERGRECTGFMALRATKEVIQFWKRVHAAMRTDGLLDQDAAHAVLGHWPCPKRVILPARYWTFGRTDTLWTPGTSVAPPDDLLVHHANWTLGVENKLKLLEAVREKMEIRSDFATMLKNVDDVEEACYGAAEKIADQAKSGAAKTNARWWCPTCRSVRNCTWQDAGQEWRCDVCHFIVGAPDPAMPNGVFADAFSALADAMQRDRDEIAKLTRKLSETEIELSKAKGPATAFGADGILRWTRDVKKDELVTIVHDGVAYERSPELSRAIGAMDRYQPRRGRAKEMIERHPMGTTAAVASLLEAERAKARAKHHPMLMAIVLQFWKGDKRRAMKLARLLADIEPCKREDVGLVFARQANCPMDAEIQETMLYVGMKFPVCDIETKVDESKPYPGVCFDPWASACQQLSDAFFTGRLPYSCGFFIEADGAPVRRTWIDDIKRAHEETLLAGKRVTGPLMRFGGVDRLHRVGGHINGTLLMEWSFWEDHPSLRRCPPGDAWDVFHGHTFRMESHFTEIIRNHHGMQGMTQNQFHITAKESAWVTSIKDLTHQHWARLTFVRD